MKSLQAFKLYGKKNVDVVTSTSMPLLDLRANVSGCSAFWVSQSCSVSFSKGFERQVKANGLKSYSD